MWRVIPKSLYDKGTDYVKYLNQWGKYKKSGCSPYKPCSSEWGFYP